MVFILSCSQFIFVVSLALSEPLTYGDYLYPAWGQALGWLLSLSSMIVVPAFAVYNVATFEGDSWKMVSDQVRFESLPVQAEIPEYRFLA